MFRKISICGVISCWQYQWDYTSCSGAFKTLSNLHNKYFWLFREKIKRKTKEVFDLIWWQYLASLAGFCGSSPGRHRFQRGFERQHSQTNLNPSQPELCLPFSSKHLGCPKTSWKRAVCRGTKYSEHPAPFSAPVILLCLCKTQAFHSCFPRTVLYCISVGVLFLRSKQTITVASRLLNKHWWKICQIKLYLYRLLLFRSLQWLKDWPGPSSLPRRVTIRQRVW